MIELNDLSLRKRPAAQSVDQLDDQRDDDHDLAAVDDGNYAIPSVILVLVSLIFLGAPGFAFYLASLSSSAEHAVTPLERFLFTHLGIYMSVVGISLLLRTTKHPLLIPLTIGSSLSSFLSYNTSTVGSLATLFFLSHLAVAIWGSYTLLFGDEAPHLSKTTGADKRTSAFIFGNKAAASSQKKEWKQRMKGEIR